MIRKTPSLYEKGHKELQHIIGFCQWLIVAGRFGLTYAVIYLRRISADNREGHLELAKKNFEYLKKYPKLRVCHQTSTSDHTYGV